MIRFVLVSLYFVNLYEVIYWWAKKYTIFQDHRISDLSLHKCNRKMVDISNFQRSDLSVKHWPENSDRNSIFKLVTNGNHIIFIFIKSVNHFVKYFSNIEFRIYNFINFNIFFYYKRQLLPRFIADFYNRFQWQMT